MRIGKRIVAGGVLLALGLAGGCAGPDPRFERDGVQYGVTEGVFRGRWWSYYERGASYLNGQYYEEAAADFVQARAGRAQDSWRARTYGLHFVEYFPTRELGVAYYHLGRLDEAAPLLEESLGHIDTERAHYYLDLVTKARIASGQVKDEAAPALQLAVAAVEQPAAEPAPEPAATPEPAPAPAPKEEAKPAPAPAPKPAAAAPAPKPAPKPAPAPAAPKPANLVKEHVVPVEVAAADDVGVEQVAVNGTPVPQRGAAAEVTVKQDVVLSEGTHEIEVKATDLAAKEQVTKVEVTVDLTGPTIGVFAPIEPTVTERGTVILEGATADKHGVTEVNVGDTVLAESLGTPRLEFDSELPLSDGENTFVLAARDVAGNETRSAVKVFKGDPDSAEAKLWLLEQRLGHRVMLASADPLILDLLLAQTEPADGKVPDIRIKSPKAGTPYRHNRALRISGEVVTQSPITSLTINGEPFEALTGAPKESFNKRIPIPESAAAGQTMQVSVVAANSAGEQLEKNFEVAVSPVALNAPETRMPLAVLAYGAQGVDASVSELLRVSSEASLVSAGRFRVLDRVRLQDVLTEQQLSSALSDPNEALTLGRLTPAQAFVVADVFARDANGVEIKARAVATETSELIATLDVFIDDRGDRAKVEAACADLAAQLERTFPRLSGEVLSVRGDELLLNWTAEDGVRPGSYVLLVQETPAWIDETTGEVLEPGAFAPVGRAQVTAVSATSTRARTVETQEAIAVEQGMPAVTQ